MLTKFKSTHSSQLRLAQAQESSPCQAHSMLQNNQFLWQAQNQLCCTSPEAHIRRRLNAVTYVRPPGPLKFKALEVPVYTQSSTHASHHSQFAINVTPWLPLITEASGMPETAHSGPFHHQTASPQQHHLWSRTPRSFSCWKQAECLG